jgi:hypothetical protein
VEPQSTNAEAILANFKHQQRLQDKFNKLRPTWRAQLVRRTFSILLLFLLPWFYPEIHTQPAFYILLAMVVLNSLDMYSESENINNRIDVLYKLLADKQDVEVNRPQDEENLVLLR